MKVLFVYRGFGEKLTNPVVDAQAKSLINSGVNIEKFPISSGGFGYIKAYFKLKRHLSNNTYDIVHGHYSYSAIIASLANKGKTIGSLMVGDIDLQNSFLKWLGLFFSRKKWSSTIVKSRLMQKSAPHAVVIPNGVNFKIFRPIDKNEAKAKVGFNNKYHAIFVAQQPEKHKWKNLDLAKEAISLIKDEAVSLKIVNNVTQKELSLYYSAADLLLVTSSLEGSPNVVKEAMACNCPIVSTDIADIKEVIGKTKGCYLTNFDPENISDKIKMVLKNGERTSGREDIRWLSSDSIAKRVINLYDGVLES